MSWKFPDGLVIRTRHFHCQGPGSVPGQGTKILQAMQRGKKKKKKVEERSYHWTVSSIFFPYDARIVRTMITALMTC